MSEKVPQPESSAHAPSDSKKNYKDCLRKLQIELVKLQRHFIECNDKILIILEGRAASGKDKRLIWPDPQVVFAYDFSNLEDGQLAK